MHRILILKQRIHSETQTSVGPVIYRIQIKYLLYNLSIHLSIHPYDLLFQNTIFTLHEYKNVWDRLWINKV